MRRNLLPIMVDVLEPRPAVWVAVVVVAHLLESHLAVRLRIQCQEDGA
jgi:hypothetical protein